MIQFVCDVCGVVNVREETHDLNHPYGYLWQPVIGPRVKLLVYPEFGERDGEHVCSACLLAGLEELIKAMVNPVPHVDLEAIQDMVDSLPEDKRRIASEFITAHSAPGHSYLNVPAELPSSITDYPLPGLVSTQAEMQDRSAKQNEAGHIVPGVQVGETFSTIGFDVADDGKSFVPSAPLVGGEYASADSPALAPGPSSPDPDVQPVPTAPEGQGTGADLPTHRLPDGVELRPLPYDAHLYTFYALHPDGIVYGHEHDKPCPVEACTYYLTEPEAQIPHVNHWCRPKYKE